MKYVFIVDTIETDYIDQHNSVENFPHTVTYNYYKKHYAKDIPINDIWINESLNLIRNYSKNIEFQTLQQVIKQGLDKNKKYFYFINQLHINKLKIFHFDFNVLLNMSTAQIAFLKKHKIPVIVDRSAEDSQLYNCYVFDQNLRKFIKANPHYHQLLDLKWKLVFSTYLDQRRFDQIKNYHELEIDVSVFPVHYFWYAMLECDPILYWTKRLQNSTTENQLFDNVKNKKIKKNIFLSKKIYENAVDLTSTKDQLPINEKVFYSKYIWETYCHKPNVARILLQAKLENCGLVKYGRYSRLQPAKKCFLTDVEKMLKSTPNYVSDNFVSKLDNIIMIDQLDQHHYFPNFIDFSSTIDQSLFRIVTETFDPLEMNDVYNTHSVITEKCSSAIVSCSPFITLGGKYIKKMLNYYNFIEYPHLEIAEIDNILDEIDYVVDKVQQICSMSVGELDKLNNSWKEIAIENYKNFYSIDVEQEYLKAIENTNFYKLD